MKGDDEDRKDTDGGDDDDRYVNKSSEGSSSSEAQIDSREEIRLMYILTVCPWCMTYRQVWRA